MANANEEAALKSLFNTPGSVNPQTGLHQYPPGGGQAAHDHAAAGGGGNSGSGGKGGSGGFSDARNSAGLDSAGHYGGGNLGGGGGYNGTGRSLPAGQMTIGGPARAVQANADPYGANSPTSQALGMHQGMTPQSTAAAMQAQHNFVDANQAYSNRSGLQKFGEGLLGAIPGMNTVQPNLNNPNTYAGGTYHQQVNPAGAALGALGMASGVPFAGSIGELAGGGLYNAAGGQNYSLGGAGVDPQTGQSTGTGWTDHPVGGFGGFGSPGQPGSQGNGHAGPDTGAKGGLAAALAGKPATVGTNAGTLATAPIADGYPGAPITLHQSNPISLPSYMAQPWTNYPRNIWRGGGSGSQ